MPEAPLDGVSAELPADAPEEQEEEGSPDQDLQEEGMQQEIPMPMDMDGNQLEELTPEQQEQMMM